MSAGSGTKELFELVAQLRAEGLAVGTDRVVLAAEALAGLPADPYRSLRVTLCTRASDLPIFDAVWASRSAAEPVPDEVAAGTVEPGAGTAAPGAETEPPTGQPAAAGGEDELTRRDVVHLTPAEREEIQRLIALLVPAAPRRPAMRRVPSRTGRIDAPATMRLMLRNGGEPSRILRSRRAQRPRRLLMLIDVSGSMRAYSDVMLRFAHAAVAVRPGTTEVFTVGTRWTRLTVELRARDADAAMRAVAEVETDWGRGTRLGPVLRDFLRHWGGRTVVRSSVVVISSDGVEYGNMAVLPQQVARLARLGHVVIWVNPALGDPGYRPVNPALDNSLPHVVAHLPGHSFEALRELAGVIAR
ncbi:VWA domain-containing protein [Dactylosporangium sp. NBC_01737]|uniref:vWA domain-containing protein n=1 Tax=Dactylosporangium sp. NBC_01737 TaxID=2975959 RepID=UPI002E0FA775|nr:VWA domain-containing protein [Dactylosporangium sp. NBC_01737]